MSILPAMKRSVGICIVAISAMAIDLVALAPSPVAAGTLSSWTGGGGTGDWSTVSNWSTPLSTSGTFDLVFGGTTRTSGTNTVGIVNVSSITFTNTGTTNQNVTFSLGGQALALNDSSITSLPWLTAMTGSSVAAGDVIGNNLLLSGSNTVTLGVNHKLTLQGVVSGTGSLTFSGGGSAQTITYLSGNNTYSGGTLITGGVVQTGGVSNTASNNAAFGTGDVTVSGSGALLVRNNTTLANNLTLSGTGLTNRALLGSFGTTGTATVTGSITLAGNVSIGAASSVASDSTSTFVLAGPVLLGSNRLTLVPGIASGATRSLLIDISGAISGAGSVEMSGTSAATVARLSGANTYTGTTTITSGTIIVNNASALGNLAALEVNTNGLDLNGFSVSSGPLSGNSSGVIRSDVAGSATLTTNAATNSTYAGSITDGSGTVGLTKAGAGVLTLSGSSNYSGPTTINGGAISLGSATALPGAGDITFGGGTLRYSPANTLDYSARFRSSSGPISIDTNGETVNFNTAIVAGNVGGLAKLGAGTLYLNATNLYGGTTTVSAGTLSGTGSVAGVLSVAAGAVFDPGPSSLTTSIFGVGGFAQVAAGLTNLRIDGATPGALYDQVAFSGSSAPVVWGGTLAITMSGSYANDTSFNLFAGFTSQSGDLSGISFSAAGTPYDGLAFAGPINGTWWRTEANVDNQFLAFNQATGTLVVVPEPGTLVMGGLGAAFVGLRVLRRRWRRDTASPAGEPAGA